MFIPILLLALAVLSAGIVAYGTNAIWAQYAHGLDVIVWSERLQWPLIALSLILCLVLLALIASGKRRAWWLIGLGPVLALFVHRFITNPQGGLGVLENPTFVPTSEASFLADDDYVVGVQFGENTYAYPYQSLFSYPIVIQNDRDKRMLLLWSAFANRAVAQTVAHDMRARNLEPVSMPANALLVYDRAYGQFINGLTGRLINGQKPIGFDEPLLVSTGPWKQWRDANPLGSVMRPPPMLKSTPAPTTPIQPVYPMPPAILDYSAQSRIVLVGTTQPTALKAEQITNEPLRITVDGGPAFVFRESPDAPVRAYSCFLRKQGLFPTFHLDREHKFKNSMFIDSDTGSSWSAAGQYVGGLKEFRKELQGTRLTPMPVQDHLYWGVMKFWYPDLQLFDPGDSKTATSES